MPQDVLLPGKDRVEKLFDTGKLVVIQNIIPLATRVPGASAVRLQYANGGHLGELLDLVLGNRREIDARVLVALDHTRLKIFLLQPIDSKGACASLSVYLKKKDMSGFHREGNEYL